MQTIPSEQLEIDRKERVDMPYQDPSLRPPTERVCDFGDVTIPLDFDRAMLEAARRIHCPDPAPCMLACPAHNDIPSAMWLIEQGRYIEAAQLYRSNCLIARNLLTRLPSRCTLPGFLCIKQNP